MTCKDTEFRCASNKCIPENHLCDGEADCVGAEDEADEVCKSKTCEPNQFKCANNKCINKDWLCDSFPNCGVGADDEAADMCINYKS